MLLAGLALLAYTAYQATICARDRNWDICACCLRQPRRSKLQSSLAAARCRPPARLDNPRFLNPLLLFDTFTCWRADRETLRLTQQEFEGLPLPLLAQLVAAVAACLLGSLAALGRFQPIRIADVPK